jgi:hypothetical protein
MLLIARSSVQEHHPRHFFLQRSPFQEAQIGLREHHLAPLKLDDERNCAPEERALGLAHVVLTT